MCRRGLQSEQGGVRMCERNKLGRHQSQYEGGAEDAPGAGASIPLKYLVQSMVSQAVPLQPMEVSSGAEIHLWRSPHQSKWRPERRL